MNVYMQAFPAFQPSLLSPICARPWLLKRQYSAVALCPVTRKSALHWACSQMERHVDANLNALHKTPQTSSWRLQHSLNVSSRWVTVAVILAIFAWRHDDQVLWALTGSIMNSFSSKLLKKFLNQERPLTALGLKADPGMPSSHAQSFGFLGFYAAIAVMFWKGMNPVAVASSALIFLFCFYLAWLRYAEGLHTLPQVVVGVIIGYCMAAVWIALWHLLVREMVASSVTHHRLLVGFFGLSALGFFAFGLRKWRLGQA